MRWFVVILTVFVLNVRLAHAETWVEYGTETVKYYLSSSWVEIPREKLREFDSTLSDDLINDPLTRGFTKSEAGESGGGAAYFLVNWSSRVRPSYSDLRSISKERVQREFASARAALKTKSVSVEKASFDNFTKRFDFDLHIRPSGTDDLGDRFILVGIPTEQGIIHFRGCFGSNVSEFEVEEFRRFALHEVRIHPDIRYKIRSSEVFFAAPGGGKSVFELLVILVSAVFLWFKIRGRSQ